jgi:hypothetical protein
MERQGRSGGIEFAIFDYYFTYRRRLAVEITDGHRDYIDLGAVSRHESAAFDMNKNRIMGGRGQVKPSAAVVAERAVEEIKIGRSEIIGPRLDIDACGRRTAARIEKLYILEIE